MPKSRNRKNHKKKLSLRNKRIADKNSKLRKIQRDFLFDLIQREQEKGLFENTVSVDESNDSLKSPSNFSSDINIPSVDIETTDGPSI